MRLVVVDGFTQQGQTPMDLPWAGLLRQGLPSAQRHCPIGQTGSALECLRLIWGVGRTVQLALPLIA